MPLPLDGAGAGAGAGEPLLEREAAPARRCRPEAVLILAKAVRSCSYGMLATTLYAYLLQLGLDTARIGVLMTIIMAGDLVISLLLSAQAERLLSRRGALVCGALLKALGGAAFAMSSGAFAGLAIAGCIGVISSTGGEVGPFVAMEQAALTETMIFYTGEAAARQRVPTLFAWYNAAGYAAQALGSLIGGALVSVSTAYGGLSDLDAGRVVLALYGGLGVLLALLYWLGLDATVEAPVASGRITDAETGASASSSASASASARHPPLSSATKFIVLRLCGLFVVDAFAGGLIAQSWLALWFSRRWGLEPVSLGALLAAANVVSGLSGVPAAWLVHRIGAINTMVFTHLPSNVLLIVVPLAQSATAAEVVLIARYCISQMDVPARQAYLALAVAPHERAAAAGLTTTARTIGLMASPLLQGWLTSVALDAPFFLAAGLKILYDLALWLMYWCTAWSRL